MRGNVIILVMGLLVAIVLGFSGCGGGSSTATQSNQSTSVVGAWKTGTLTTTFASNGSFTSMDTVNGINVSGTYSTSGNQLSFTDAGGPSSCAAGQATGTYTFMLSSGGTTLALNKVSDNCTGRTTAIDGRNFTRQ